MKGSTQVDAKQFLHRKAKPSTPRASARPTGSPRAVPSNAVTSNQVTSPRSARLSEPKLKGPEVRPQRSENTIISVLFISNFT